MIDRNIGNIERLLRLLMGMAMAVWALSQNALNGMDWFVVAVSIALILNGVFSRCYLWYVLDVDTHGAKDKNCQPDYTCP